MTLVRRFPDVPYIDDAPMPRNIPKVDEIGVTSAPLKTAAFFIGAHCKDFNGASHVSLILKEKGSKKLT